MLKNNSYFIIIFIYYLMAIT